MDLYDDIEKVTQIPFTDDNASFVPLKGPSQAMRDRRMNQRRLRPPRNINLVESVSEDSNMEQREAGAGRIERVLNPHEIAASIKAVNGGLDYSNEFLEHHWKSVKLNMSSSSESLCDQKSKLSSSSPSNLSTSSSSSCGNSNRNNNHDNNNEGVENLGKIAAKALQSKRYHNAEEKEEILKRCRLSRNAAIRSLVCQNKIPIENLQIPNEERPQINLVPCPEDPDILLQPLLAYGKVDESRCKGIDFTVAHIGKKEKITPRQFYLNQSDDSFFEFVKRKPKEK